MIEKTLLISSAGRRNHLIQCFREDSVRLGIRLRILTCDLDPEMSPACQAGDRSFAVPRCTDPGFAARLRRICQDEKVDLVVPTIDPELPVLSGVQADFRKIGTWVVVSDTATVALARNKLQTARTLALAGLRTPSTITLAELVAGPARLRWPVIVKPNSGSASQNIRRLESASELSLVGRDDGLIAQEYQEGLEYTVNVYFDATGCLCCAVPHLRIETRGGEVSKGRTEDVPALAQAAHLLAMRLPGARGPLCFQAILAPDGTPVIFEINARFGGGFPLAHRAGARFTQWLLEEAVGLPSSATDQWKPGVTMLRYDSAVFRGD